MTLLRTAYTTALCLTLVCSCSVGEEGADQKEAFTPLFNGKTLDGWVRRGGEATYRVEVDAKEGPQIVGVSTADTPNTFLCTERDYADFVLEFEVKIDSSLNSGVQFRSIVTPKEVVREIRNSAGDIEKRKIPAGTVQGYQAEIDPTLHAWSGGIYDEARRGWLFNLRGEDRYEARQAFKPNEWNHYRIEAIGPSIKTFINGTPVADLTDDMTTTGFIGLQVHAIKDPAQAGKEIRWRNLQIRER